MQGRAHWLEIGKPVHILGLFSSPVLKQFFFRNIYREGYYGVPDDQKSLS